jgi:hypothetical protein
MWINTRRGMIRPVQDFNVDKPVGNGLFYPPAKLF